MSQESDFERLVDLYYQSLYRFALSLTRQENDACDLTQHTFYVWARKGHQLQDKNKVKSWLFTTLHREYLERRRRITRFPQVDLAEAEQELPQVTPVSSENLDATAVLKALSKIEELFQAPIALFYLEDYSYPEIAHILGI